MSTHREKKLQQYFKEMEEKGIEMPKNLSPKRIKKILSMIEDIWTYYPQLRLGQVLGNCFEAEKDLFYVKDSELVKALKETYENIDFRR